MNFVDRLLPAQKDSGLHLEDQWVWCGSVIRADNPGEDGRYHMFASVWPKNLNFPSHWATNCQIARASSDTAAGPYKFEEIALPWRHHSHWDGGAVHNPCIRKWNGRYYLYHIGTTYDFPTPTVERPLDIYKYPEHWEIFQRVWETKRTGVAVADSVTGPWKRCPEPLLQPRPGEWDTMIISNPSVAIREDGYTVLVYKSRRDWQAPFEIGVATAPHPEGPFTRASDGPVFPLHVEDPCIWWENGRYHVVMKDFSGDHCGVSYGGVYGWSEDGISWNFPPKSLAYSRTVKWEDGTSTEHGNFERPFVIMEDGKSTHLLGAITKGQERWNKAVDTWNIIIPLAPW